MLWAQPACKKTHFGHELDTEAHRMGTRGVCTPMHHHSFYALRLPSLIHNHSMLWWGGSELLAGFCCIRKPLEHTKKSCLVHLSHFFTL